MEVCKRAGKAFLIGGVLGAAAQLVMMAVTAALGTGSSFIVPVTLLVMCLVAVLAYPSGLYGKWIGFGNIGAMLPISGLTSGVSAAYCGALQATGSRSEGVKAGIMLVVRLSGSGLVAALVVALVLSFAM